MRSVIVSKSPSCKWVPKTKSTANSAISQASAQVQAKTTSTQGVPDTLLLETTEEVPVEVVTLYVRKPNPDAAEEGGPRFTFETISGAANIRQYLGG